MKRKVLLAACLTFWTGSTVLALAGEENDPLAVRLSDVVGCPEAYKTAFEIDLLFHSVGRIYNPFYSVFEPSAYLNFSAWGSTSEVWTRNGYQSDHPLFYVDRVHNAKTERAIMDMKPFSWFRATCVVRSTSHSRAWIEVLKVGDSDTTMTWTEIQKMIRGSLHAEQGLFDQALAEFSTVNYKGMPKPFTAMCKNTIGRTALAAGKCHVALINLRVARKCFPYDLEIAAACDAAESGQTLAMKSSQKPAGAKKAGAKPKTETTEPIDVGMEEESSEHVDPDSLREWPDEANSDGSAKTVPEHSKEMKDPGSVEQSKHAESTPGSEKPLSKPADSVEKNSAGSTQKPADAPEAKTETEPKSELDPKTGTDPSTKPESTTEPKSETDPASPPATPEGGGEPNPSEESPSDGSGSSENGNG